MIKVAYSTVNPFDRIMYKTNKTEGFVLGSDGSGVIVEVGEGVSEENKGKKVAFLGNGYSKYVVKDMKLLVFFDDEIDLAVCANTFVNPFTVLAQLDFA